MGLDVSVTVTSSVREPKFVPVAYRAMICVPPNTPRSAIHCASNTKLLPNVGAVKDVVDASSVGVAGSPVVNFTTLMRVFQRH